MKLRNTLVLFSVAVALGLFIVLFEAGGPTTDEAEDLALRAFPEFKGKTRGADAIEIVRGPDRIVLVKRDAGRSTQHWRITQPIEYRADLSRVIGLLGAFEGAKKTRIGEKGETEIRLAPAASVKAYGLDAESAVRVIIFAGRDRLLDVLVGSGASENRVYVSHYASRDPVYVVGDEVRDEAMQTVDGFRDKRLVDLVMGKVTGIEILRENKLAAGLARDADGRWHVVSPVADRADGKRVEDIVDRMGSLWADRFVADFAPDDPARAERLAGYGLLPPERSVKITVELAGRKRQHEILFGGKIKKTETGQAPSWDVYAMVAGTDSVVNVPAESVGVLDVALDALRDRSVMDFSRNEAASVTVRRPAGDLRIERDGDGWSLVQAAGDAAGASKRSADRERVRDFLQALIDLRVKGFLPSDTMLDSPLAVEVAFERPEEQGAGEAAPARPSELVHFEPGRGETIRARRGKRGAVFEVPSAILKDLTARAYRFYDRKVLSFDARNLNRLSITAGGVECAATRGAAGWTLVRAGGRAGERGGDIAPVRADDIKWKLSDLEAVEYVEKLAEVRLADYGLDPAGMRVEIAVKTGAAANGSVLLVGSPREGSAEGAGMEYYAAIEDGEMLFLVGGELVTKLREGFVKRADGAGKSE